MKYKDYYEILGVPRTASEPEIKAAYRKLARQYHPDVSKEKDAEARFKEIGEAYQVLKDADTRASYDRMGPQWRAGQDFQPPPNWGGDFAGADFGDFVDSMFGRSGHARGRRSPHARGEDQHATIAIDLEDSFRGAQRTINLRMPTRDPSGRVSLQERTLSINIPQGIRSGQSLRLAGQGGPGMGQGQAGDLLLEISFKPHRTFHVEDRDVYMTLPLAPWEAALGATVDVPTPDGSVLQLNVPAGATAGRKLRLRGRGLPGSPAGDLYAEVTIVLPPADTDEARAAYEALRKAFDFNPRGQS